MSTAVVPSGLSSEAFSAFLARRTEPAWLIDARRAAWQAFERTPWPTSREETWRRTDLRLFRPERVALSSDAASAPADAGLLREGIELAGSVLVHNSQCTHEHLDPSYAQQGVRFGSLDLLARDEESLVRRFLGSVHQADADRFAALHAAVWSGGTLLYVPRGVAIERPLYMLSSMSDGGADLGRALIVLDEGAEATLLAETSGGDHGGFHAGGIEIVLAPGAKLRYVNLQDWGRGVWHFAQQRAVLQRGAAIQWTIGALGARLAKVDQHVTLAGRDAMAQVNGVMFTEGKQHLAYHTLQHHQVEHGQSDLLYKGALQDQSQLVWRGMIKVDAGAQKTDAYQRNDNLMLSADAQAHSIPGLEIEADDVRCTHGSTTGRVDEEQVFYARCRGLTRNEAVRMIVAGFFQQVFDRITIESVRDALALAIGRRIRNYD